MFTITLQNGKQIRGDQAFWHDLPKDLVIAKLGVFIYQHLQNDQMMVLADDELEGFEQYGFHMYTAHVPGAEVGAGVQILAVSGDRFLTVDINLANGQRRSSWKPLSEMTYNRDLLRKGVSSF